jgi:hypothetical protein
VRRRRTLRDRRRPGWSPGGVGERAVTAAARVGGRRRRMCRDGPAVTLGRRPMDGRGRGWVGVARGRRAVWPPVPRPLRGGQRVPNLGRFRGSAYPEASGLRRPTRAFERRTHRRGRCRLAGAHLVAGSIPNLGHLRGSGGSGPCVRATTLPTASVPAAASAAAAAERARSTVPSPRSVPNRSRWTAAPDSKTSLARMTPAARAATSAGRWRSPPRARRRRARAARSRRRARRPRRRAAPAPAARRGGTAGPADRAATARREAQTRMILSWSGSGSIARRSKHLGVYRPPDPSSQPETGAGRYGATPPGPLRPRSVAAPRR